MKQTIIIIGAGAAGLMAARLLSEQGYHVVITEADSRIGGRIHTITRNDFEGVIEAGAEFVHGDLVLTSKLLHEAGIPMKLLTGNAYTVSNGTWTTQENVAPGWDLLLEKMQQLQEDMTIAGFLDQYFPVTHYEPLRHAVQRFAAGFDLADIRKANVFAIRDEWQQDMGHQFRVQGGYGQLVTYLCNRLLAHGGELRTSFVVKKLRWKSGTVSVVAADGSTIEGSKAIITVPLGVLQAAPSDASGIAFEPAIDSYRETAREMGYGSVIKILLHFSRPCWRADTGFILSDQPVPTWWTQLPDTRPVLTGWLGGEQHALPDRVSDEEVLALAFHSLSAIFNIPEYQLRQLVTAFEVHNWKQRPYAMGGYSYSTLHTRRAQEIFSEPIEQTLYFAGEAFYKGPAPGTVEAALVSSQHVAEKIISGK
jgi:monoamine oxidase